MRGNWEAPRCVGGGRRWGTGDGRLSLIPKIFAGWTAVAVAVFGGRLWWWPVRRVLVARRKPVRARSC